MPITYDHLSILWHLQILGLTTYFHPAMMNMNQVHSYLRLSQSYLEVELELSHKGVLRAGQVVECTTKPSYIRNYLKLMALNSEQTVNFVIYITFSLFRPVWDFLSLKVKDNSGEVRIKTVVLLKVLS